ncbi:MAG: class I SAM-dependent RNA methyltransferase, partial [Lentisphaeria bacterium]|nr:class I SAM-dependent RNA methyltransferase [Lentisphaeria bacterium]
MKMLESGQLVELTISDVAFGGDGVARMEDGQVVFVPYTAVGDHVRVQIVEAHRNFARGVVAELLEGGEGREEPLCPHYGLCGGCRYQHLTYEKEVATKAVQLQALLRRVGGFDELPPLAAIIPSATPYGYRNKLRVEPLGPGDPKAQDPHVSYGYCQLDNKTFFELDTCPLAAPALNEFLPKAQRTPWAKKNARRPKPYPMTLRQVSDGSTHLYFGHAPSTIPWLIETLLGREVRVPLGVFWQVNSAVAEILVGTVRDWFAEAPSETLVDAYSGVGTFSLALAEHAKRCVLIETSRDSLKAAEHNHLQWGTPNFECLCGKAGSMLQRTLPKCRSNDTTVLLDPTRSGCEPKVIDAIMRHRPEQILYVSCNAST